MATKAKTNRTIKKKSRNAPRRELELYTIGSRYLSVIYRMLSREQRRELESFALYLKSRGGRRRARERAR
jgi:hypothetical protein